MSPSDLDFLGLLPTDDPTRWRLPVTDNLTVGPDGRRFLFGGAGLGAGLAALQGTLQRPPIWATAQYLDYARAGDEVIFEVETGAQGKTISQARVRATVGARQILNLTAALGTREGPSDQWTAPLKVPQVEACSPVAHWRGRSDGINAHFEMRLAHGRYPRSNMSAGRSDDGRLALWVRPINGQSVGIAVLAILADFVPSGISNALGYHAGGNSLDNTIRFGPLEATDWVLCDIAIDAVVSGIVHGGVRLFAPSGRLLASASQSLILRIHPPPEP